MITKEEYALPRVKNYLYRKAESNEIINVKVLINLIEQWEFDYEMEKEYRSEMLSREKHNI
ncbi:hypothetical protein [Oceanobacillus sp. FSL H7-0719]|uniref:hypothetical protein n=1 Tax=Oceanobacillus sp. FSL H7-0719 TaxID=2954507 RepID=UPI00324F545C